MGRNSGYRPVISYFHSNNKRSSDIIHDRKSIMIVVCQGHDSILCPWSLLHKKCLSETDRGAHTIRCKKLWPRNVATSCLKMNPAWSHKEVYDHHDLTCVPTLEAFLHAKIRVILQKSHNLKHIYDYQINTERNGGRTHHKQY